MALQELDFKLVNCTRIRTLKLDEQLRSGYTLTKYIVFSVKFTVTTLASVMSYYTK